MVWPGAIGESGATADYSRDREALDSNIRRRIAVQVVRLGYAAGGRVRGLVHRHVLLLLVASAEACERILAGFSPGPSLAVAH